MKTTNAEISFWIVFTLEIVDFCLGSQQNHTGVIVLFCPLPIVWVIIGSYSKESLLNLLFSNRYGLELVWMNSLLFSDLSYPSIKISNPT